MLRKEATQIVENMWKSRKKKEKGVYNVLNVHNIIVIIVYTKYEIVHINDATKNLEEILF